MASADTIVPDPSNPQSFNRYSYVFNRPTRYTDPSGHYVAEANNANPCHITCTDNNGYIIDSEPESPIPLLAFTFKSVEMAGDFSSFLDEGLGYTDAGTLGKISPAGFLLVGGAEALNQYNADASDWEIVGASVLAVGKDIVIDTVAEGAGVMIGSINPVAGGVVYVACQFQCEEAVSFYAELMQSSVDTQYEIYQHIKYEDPQLYNQLMYNPWQNPFMTPIQ